MSKAKLTKQQVLDSLEPSVKTNRGLIELKRTKSGRCFLRVAPNLVWLEVSPVWFRTAISRYVLLDITSPTALSVREGTICYKLPRRDSGLTNCIETALELDQFGAGAYLAKVFGYIPPAIEPVKPVKLSAMWDKIVEVITTGYNSLRGVTTL